MRFNKSETSFKLWKFKFFQIKYKIYKIYKIYHINRPIIHFMIQSIQFFRNENCIQRIQTQI